MMQFLVTPAAGKRLIAKAIARHPDVLSALESRMVVVMAGTTNGYVAEELLSAIGQSDGFDMRRFFRGVTLPPYAEPIEAGRLPDETRLPGDFPGDSPESSRGCFPGASPEGSPGGSLGSFPGDVVITEGVWRQGQTVFDVIDDLSEGDVILKGANAVDLASKQAGILIADPKGGTTVVALQAVVGRRVRLIVPVGLEKRVSEPLGELAALLNRPGAQGARLLPVPGEVVTEIEALSALAGVDAVLVAAGGVHGAEGSVWLAVSGSPEQEEAARSLMASVTGEPPFTLA